MIHIVEYGSGEQILVAIHGWGGDHRTFEPLTDYLSARWTLVLLDLPGYGNSPLVEPFSIEHVAEKVKLVIERYPSPVQMIGSCSGAVVALEVAHQAPESVERIIALDLFAYMPWYFRLFTVGMVGELAYRLTFDSRLGRSILNRMLRSRRSEHTDLMGSFADKSSEVTLKYLSALASLGGPYRYHCLPVDVELVYGARTFRAVRKSVGLWKQVFPRLIIHQVEHAGHLIVDEAPREVAAIIEGQR